MSLLDIIYICIMSLLDIYIHLYHEFNKNIKLIKIQNRTYQKCNTNF